MYDLVIRDGQLVDGTGAAVRPGDIAISDGRIAAVDEVTGPARRELDASGLLVTPGWVDTHSHMDGQATWDPLLAPAINHGITTLVNGEVVMREGTATGALPGKLIRGAQPAPVQ